MKYPKKADFSHLIGVDLLQDKVQDLLQGRLPLTSLVEVHTVPMKKTSSKRFKNIKREKLNMKDKSAFWRVNWQ
jgi:hypothetical protein